MILELLTRTFLAAATSHAPAHQVAVVPLVAAPGQVAAQPAVNANQIVDKVQQFYANISTVEALFRQSVTNETFGTTKNSDGKVWIMKPGKMRWDYIEKKGTASKTKKSFISNGTNLYVVEHDNLQVMKKNLQQDLMPVAVTFLYGKGDLKTEFNAAIDTSGKYGGKGEHVLKLTPKKPSAQYKTLFLVVAGNDYRVTQSIIIDSSNNTNHFRFYAPDFKKAVQTGWFEFDEKSPQVRNYRIIDADQPPPPQGSAAKPAPTPAAPIAPKK